MKPAIVIIDVLQDFFKNGRLLESKNELVANINQLTSSGRENDIPIFWVRQEFKDDLSDAFLYMKKTGNKITIENTPGSKLLPELKNEDSDYEVIKKRYSAFFNTNLDDLLKRLGIDTVIIGGINTHACVRMAGIDAYQRDYDVILATDCIDSYDEEQHRITLKYLTQTISLAKTNQEIFSLIKTEV